MSTAREILVLDESTPQIMAPQTGADTYLAPVDMTDASGNEVGFEIRSSTNKAAGNDTAFLINHTDTASPGTSLLADFQVGGSSKFKVTSGGDLRIENNYGLDAVFPSTHIIANNQVGLVVNGNGFVQVGQNFTIGWTSGTYGDDGTLDVKLRRDAADTLALRRSTNAQEFRIYNTYTNASNNEYLALDWDTNVATIKTVANGTGTARNLELAVPSGQIVELDKTTEDNGFFNFKATADADATSAISTLTTSGSTTHHIQISINGVTAWIAASTTDPT